MTTPNIQQAKEWAEIVSGLEGIAPRPRAAAEVIQSLPDQWIDADKLRNWIDGMMVSDEPGGARKLLDYIKRDFLTPPLPTLAELIEAGNKPEGYQWIQAKVFSTASTLGIITSFDEHTRSAIILFTDGMAKNVPWSFITPLPGPKLEWPSDGVVDAEIVEDDEPVMMPRPEDVHAGEAWLVKFDGHEWVGTRESRAETVCSWALARLDGADYTVASDDEITLVSRMVPEDRP